MDLKAIALKIAGGISDYHVGIQDRLSAVCEKMGLELSDDAIGLVASQIFEAHPENLEEMPDAEFAKIAKKFIDDRVKTLQGDAKQAVGEINNWFKEHYRINFDFEAPETVGKYGPAKKLKIDVEPKDLGLMSLIYKSAEVSVRFGSFVYGEKIWFMVQFDFSWQHPRGSNGYNMRITFDDAGRFREIN